jgi:hypothetical protein
MPEDALVRAVELQFGRTKIMADQGLAGQIK